MSENRTFFSKLQTIKRLKTQKTSQNGSFLCFSLKKSVFSYKYCCYFSIAAIPGSVLPSRLSNIAPPPVDT